MFRLFINFVFSVVLLLLATTLVRSPNVWAMETYIPAEYWGVYGQADGKIDFPIDVFIDQDDRVIIADYLNDRIQLFDLKGNFLAKWTGFNHPEKIAQGKDGNIYIADTNNHRIVKLTKNGEVITTWSGRFGNDFFPRGVGVAVSADNFVYSVHAVYYIEKFDANGNAVTSWGENGVLNINATLEAIRVDSQGFVYVLANDSVMKFSSSGVKVGQWGSFNAAQDLFIDKNDNVFVTNTGKGRVEKYSKDGQLLSMFGEGILNTPHGTGVDRRGSVYVADARNHRVVVFTPSVPPPFILDAPLIKQIDPTWATAPYDHAQAQQISCGTTIGQCGCALTSLAMLLNYHGVTKDPDGRPTTPQTLNAYFNEGAQCASSGCISKGYVFGEVVWSAADRYSAEASKIHNTQKIVSLNNQVSTAWDPVVVHEDINNYQPVIIEVQKNQHWALATGIDQNTFVINDPLRDIARLSASPYNNRAASIRRFKKTASDFSLLELITKSPGVVSVTDPAGAILTGSTSAITNTLTIGSPRPGEYKVAVTSDAPVVPLAVYASNKAGELQFKLLEQKNPLQQNNIYTYSFIYSPTDSTNQLRRGVTIDIEPYVKNNVGFCRNSSLMIPVAVLGSNTLDIRSINDASVTFEGAKNLFKHPTSGKSFHLTQDVNRDGRPDAVYNFLLKKTHLLCSSTKGKLIGQLKDGMYFEGTDHIRMFDTAKPAKQGSK